MVHPKKLVFHFYAGDDWEKSPIYCLHKYFLTKYSGIFDSAEFYIAVNDLNDKATIESVEHFLIGCGFKDVRFFVQKNTWMCEAETLKRHVIDNLKHEDSHIFFAHSKGVMDYQKKGVEKDTLLTWITALYYLNLEYSKEAEWAFLNANSVFFGGLMELYNGNHTQAHAPKNNWLYCGGFYWINCPELLSRFGEEIPYPYDRFYGENLPGNLCEAHDYEAYTHNYMMIPSWEFDRVGSTYDSVYGRVKCTLKDEEMELFDLEIKRTTQIFNDYILKSETA